MDMNILTERESKLLEFKSTIPKFDTLIKTCIAFANASGGKIIIGVEDKTREIVGITNNDRNRIYDDFTNSLFDSVSPTIIAQIYERNFGKKSVLIIEIPMSPRKPYFLKSKGIKDGTYIRVGSSTRKASQEYIEDLTREAQRISYDEETIYTPIDNLDKELLYQFFNATVTKKRLFAEKIIGAKHANKEIYCPTVSGLLMFSENPHHFVPEALIKCTRFKGTQGRNILRTEDITGTIEQQASAALRLISDWIAIDYALRGIKLTGTLPIPEEALREAILNALLHRKYSIPGATKIAVYDDRLEIFNPGDFPGLIDINNLGDGTTFLRNPTLIKLAYKSKLVETRGTGIRLIYDSCRNAGIKKPVYEDEGDFVKLIFYFDKIANPLQAEDTSIINYIKEQKSVTSQQIADYLSVSRNTAIRKLNTLIISNKVIKTGQGPSIKYQLKKFHQ